MKLRMQVRPPSGPAFEITHAGPRIRIGRDPSADIVFDNAGQDNVSWEHAQITLTDKAASLTDLGSTNGTYLNGGSDRLKSCALKVGDEFRLGVTGPRVRVLELQLAIGPTVVPPTAKRPANYGAVPVKAAGVSFTRKLLIQSQSRNRTMLGLVSGIFLLLLLLVAAVIWLTNRNVDQVVADTGKIKAKVDDIAFEQAELRGEFQKVAKQVTDVAGAMDDFTKQQVVDREKDRQRIDQAVREAGRINAEVLAEAKKLADQGKPADPKRQPVKNLGEVNDALGGAAGEAGEAALEFRPGMVLSIRKKNSANLNSLDHENAALAFAGKEHLELVGFDAKHTFKVKYEDVETIYVKDQMYRYNLTDKRFEPGISHYRLDKSSGFFVKLSDFDEDLSGKEWGSTIGERSVKCFIGQSSTGLVVSLPRGVYRSSQFPAKSLGEIVTNFGVHRWDESKNEYVFQTHKAMAKVVQEELEKKREAQRDKEWARRVESYKLVTDRIRAARPYWWYWW